MNVAAAILAAGESARLGRPKQLVQHRGRSLLRHVIACAREGGCAPVIVVMGAREQQMRGEIEGIAATPVLNRQWAEGMHTSIRAALEYLERMPPELPAPAALLLLACDQPQLSPQVVAALRRRFDAGAGGIVACEYAGTLGVPALFGRDHFPELASLVGPGGAKSVLQAHSADVVRFPWPGGAVDIDREEDLNGAES